MHLLWEMGEVSKILDDNPAATQPELVDLEIVLMMGCGIGTQRIYNQDAGTALPKEFCKTYLYIG